MSLLGYLISYTKPIRFNPLDRGNLYLIRQIILQSLQEKIRFNPLDRGNLYQISDMAMPISNADTMKFQSPRSGKFVSDSIALETSRMNEINAFQSPLSGKFVSDFQSNCKS